MSTQNIERRTLGSVATYINGRAFKPSEWEEKGLPIIRIQNLTDKGAPANRTTAMYEDKYKVRDGDLLFAWSASLGAHIWHGGDAWLNQHIFKVMPNADVDKMYLYYYLQQVTADLYAKTHGSGMVHITKGPFMSTPILIPPLKEQQRIVSRIEELSSSLDQAVQTLQETKRQLAVYRQAVMSRAFDMKKGWEKVKVSDIGEVNLGRQRSPKNVSKDYPTKYIRAANITEHGIDVTDVLEMEFTPSDRKKYTLRNGDIVLSEASGSASQVGKPAIWRDEVQDCCFQNTVIRHRVDTGKAIPEFICWQYKYLYETGYFARHVGGVGINHLGAKNFSGLEINLAPLGIQRRIVSELEGRISVCDSIEKTVDSSLAQAESLRQSILKKAFEGRLI